MSTSLGRRLALLCLDCREVHHDRRGVCPYCGSEECVDVRSQIVAGKTTPASPGEEAGWWEEGEG